MLPDGGYQSVLLAKNVMQFIRIRYLALITLIGVVTNPRPCLRWLTCKSENTFLYFAEVAIE